MLLLYLGIEVIRLFFGTKGNLCQRKMPLGISMALTFPSAMMASYYLLLQTYVLRLEAIMNSILLFFCGSELLLEVLTLAAFSRACQNENNRKSKAERCSDLSPDDTAGAPGSNQAQPNFSVT
ncbi:transmembrane protein 216 isoform X4 [Manis pentadactyla]|nr:transmembrane protein 216 isoform X4 [Manis pentadactyla]